MDRIGICILWISWYLLSGEATAQQPSRIGLQVEIKGSDKFRKLLVPAGGSVDQVQQELSTALVDHIMESRYWTPFCWKLEPHNPLNEPHGLLKVTLRDVQSDTEIRVAVILVSAASNETPLNGFDLCEGRATSWPRGELLRDKLNDRFTSVFLESSVKEEEFHLLLRRKIPVGTGMVNHNLSIAPNDSHGLILLPWNQFNSFGQARFKFRYLSENGLAEVNSEGTGLPDTVAWPPGGAPVCCLVTKHQQNPPAPTNQEPVNVFLDMPCQEIMFLPAPAVVSCTGVNSSAIPVPVF